MTSPEYCERCGVRLVILEMNGERRWMEYDPIASFLPDQDCTPIQSWYISLYVHTPIRCTNERIRKEREA